MPNDADPNAVRQDGIWRGNLIMWHSHDAGFNWIEGERCQECPPPTGKPLTVTKVDQTKKTITVSGADE